MRLFQVFGVIAGSLLLAVIFFGFFTPFAFFMKLFGRDALRLKVIKKSSYWISRNAPIKSDSFNHQL